MYKQIVRCKYIVRVTCLNINSHQILFKTSN